MGNSLKFALHYLLKPFPTPPLNELGRAFYLGIDNHFRQSTEWAKQEILGRWENITLTNPRETRNVITRTFH
jgi:hypothetical protein